MIFDEIEPNVAALKPAVVLSFSLMKIGVYCGFEEDVPKQIRFAYRFTSEDSFKFSFHLLREPGENHLKGSKIRIKSKARARARARARGSDKTALHAASLAEDSFKSKLYLSRESWRVHLRDQRSGQV